MKPGFKQTEIGPIPEDWDAVPARQIGAFRGGNGFPLVEQGETSGDYPFFKVSDMNNEGNETFMAEANHRISEQTKNRLGTTVFPADSIVFAKVGAAIFLERKKILSQPSCIDNNMAALVLDKGRADVRYIHTLLLNRKLGALVATTALPALNGKLLGEMTIPLPALPEQRTIAEVLTDADALIGSLERLIAKKRDIKQGAMQELLTGKNRLPGFSSHNTKFKQSHVGAIPEDWGLVQLVELVDPGRSIRYGIVQPGDYDPQGRFMIRGQDYSEVKGWAKPSEVFRVSPKIEERYRNARVKTGDLIMTIVGYCGHVEIVPAWLDAANLTQTTARIAIRPDRAVSAYCKYVLLSPIGRNQVAAYIKGAAQPGLNCGDLERFFITLPSIPEQTAIASSLSDMDEEIMVLEAKLSKERAIKQGMMQELLTGRIRLK